MVTTSCLPFLSSSRGLLVTLFFISHSSCVCLSWYQRYGSPCCTCTLAKVSSSCAQSSHTCQNEYLQSLFIKSSSHLSGPLQSSCAVGRVRRASTALHLGDDHTANERGHPRHCRNPRARPRSSPVSVTRPNPRTYVRLPELQAPSTSCRHRSLPPCLK